MKPTNVYQAKSRLSELIDRAIAGEEVVIARNGRPVARLVPYAAAGGRRKLGVIRDKVWMAKDFDAPLPERLLAGFEGGR